MTEIPAFHDGPLGRHTNRVILYDCVEFEASVHWMDVGADTPMPFFHLETYEDWSTFMYRLAQKRWKAWLPTWEHFPLFTMATDEPEDRDSAIDWLRRHFGFQYLQDIPCTDGGTRRLYCHYGPGAP